MIRFVFFIAIVISALPVFAQKQKLKISHLKDGFYIYTTYHDAYPSNSMYVVTSKSVLLFDTPWDSTQFQPLLDSIEFLYHKPVTFCISTHFHDDRTAGLEYFGAQGIKTWSSFQTYQLCKENNNSTAKYLFNNDTTFNIDGISFTTYYPGAGHSADNIVIWFPQYKILYGGCYIKSKENSSLGNIEDANPENWLASIKKVIVKYNNAELVIPGHYAWGDTSLLYHTEKLLKEHK